MERDKSENAPVCSEALLVGLNEDEDGPVRAMFSAFRYSRDEFLHWQATHDTQWAFAEQDSYEPDNYTPLEAFPFTSNARRLFYRADEIRNKKAEEQIRPRHLLAAMLIENATNNDNSPLDQPVAYQWLRGMGIDISHVSEVLAGLPNNSPIHMVTFILAPGKAFDDADTDVDLLGFETSSLALAEIIAKPETKPPVVIGVYGDWGSGKSTYLSLIMKHLKAWDEAAYPKERRKRFLLSLQNFYLRLRGNAQETPLPRIVTIRFNAWAYTDTAKLWAGLVKEVSARIDREIPLWRKPFFWFQRSIWKLVLALLFGLIPVLIALLLMLTGNAWEALVAQLWETLIVQITNRDSALAQLFSEESLTQTITWLTAIGSSLLIFYRQTPLYGTVNTLVKNFNNTKTEGVMSSIQDELNTTIERYFTPDEPEGEAHDESAAVLPVLPKKKIKIVILIDELDRCQLEKIVDILEAIKLFLAEKIFIVLMAIDTRVVTEAIKLHYKDADNPKLAYEYVEKIIQVPIAVPRANHGHLTQYVRQLMAIDEDKESQISTVAPKPLPVVPDPVQAPGVNRAFANSTDPLKPLQLADTATERRAITNFAATYLEGNPRRIKRLLNTYRYVKTLATRLGEKTDDEEWQAEMINWLGLTMRWPTFIQEAISQIEEGVKFDTVFLNKIYEELPEFLRPPKSALKFVPSANDPKRFAVIANNFLIENRAAAQPEDEPSENEREALLLARLQNLEAINTVQTILDKGVTEETKKQALNLLKRLSEVPEEVSA